MVATLKFIHIATVAIWMAGLVGLPGLYVQRARVAGDDELFRLQRMVRHAYLVLMSPSAFVAIASGTSLIFLREAFEPWLSAKLALVGLLAMIHTLTGLVIIRLFDKGEIYTGGRFVIATTVTLILIICVLFLALAKPQLGAAPADLFAPGNLARMFEQFTPWRKP